MILESGRLINFASSKFQFRIIKHRNLKNHLHFHYNSAIYPHVFHLSIFDFLSHTSFTYLHSIKRKHAHVFHDPCTRAYSTLPKVMLLLCYNLLFKQLTCNDMFVEGKCLVPRFPVKKRVVILGLLYSCSLISGNHFLLYLFNVFQCSLLIY